MHVLHFACISSSQQHTKSLVGIEGVYTSQQQQQCPCRKSSSLSRLRTFLWELLRVRQIELALGYSSHVVTELHSQLHSCSANGPTNILIV